MMLLALLAGVAAGPVPAETIHYRVTEALVVDKDGKPLFRAPRDFLLQVAGNPDGRVIGYDSERRRIRVSEHQPWFIPCDQLQPMASVCHAAAVKPKTRGLKLPPQSGAEETALTGPEARGVPSCPGDPRCPKG